MTTMRIIESGILPDEETKTLSIIKKNIGIATSYTSKKIGLCELTDQSYDHSDLCIMRLKGYKYIDPHPMLGEIVYHPDNEHLFKYVEAYKEFECRMVTQHNLQGLSLNFKRTSGETQQATVEVNNPIVFSAVLKYSNFLGLKLNYLNNPNEEESMTNPRLTKFVPFNDKVFSDDSQGIFGLNKDIFTDDFVLKLGYKAHDYLETEREEWKKEISAALGEIKHEYYTY